MENKKLDRIFAAGLLIAVGFLYLSPCILVGVSAIYPVIVQALTWREKTSPLSQEVIDDICANWYWIWGGEKPIYGPARVKSLLTIRQVEGMNMHIDDRLITEDHSNFQLEGGVLLGTHNAQKVIYFQSWLEVEGKVFCQVRINVKKWNIEYIEVVERFSEMTGDMEPSLK